MIDTKALRAALRSLRGEAELGLADLDRLTHEGGDELDLAEGAIRGDIVRIRRWLDEAESAATGSEAEHG